MGEYVTVNVTGGSLQAYLELPDSSPAPAVLVLHEVFGINDDMRASCRELAQHGFVALCPDLFWRQEPGLDLSHWTEAEWQKGLTRYQAYDRDQGVRDIADALAFARGLSHCSGKTAVMGYCLGGLMTFLTTARHGADSAVLIILDRRSNMSARRRWYPTRSSCTSPGTMSSCRKTRRRPFGMPSPTIPLSRSTSIPAATTPSPPQRRP